MRLRNSLLNYSTGILTNLINFMLNFVSRTVFIATLGIAYLGVNSLMTNVMAMLAIAELGIGTAITYSLYKPLANNDIKKIIMLMEFYKKAYRFIGISIFLIGMGMLFFIDIIVKDLGDVENLRLIFFLYVIMTSFPYFINYKVALIKADQKEYKLASINIIFNILIGVSQIIILLFTTNFILYLVSNIIILFIQTVYINYKVTRMYPLLKNKVTENLPKEEFNTIKTNLRAMVLHKIGDFSINSTDNIIISAFISISVVGIYSNYAMIITTLTSFVIIFFNSITASMGNLLATVCDKRKLEVFKVINFIGFWVYGFATISFYNLINPTITIWLGSDFILSQTIILVVLINYYLAGMRVPIQTVKTAAGLYDVDKYSPLIQAAINLVISIILVQKIGLIGVFIGTVISSLALPIWQRPYLIYKHVFKTSSKPYFVDFLKYGFVIIGLGLGISLFFNLYFSEVTLINYIIKIAICLIVPNLTIVLLFYNSYEFKEVIRYINIIFRRGTKANA